MKPFLLLATRAEVEAADDEYAAFLRCGGLEPHQLERVRMEQQPLGEIDLGRYSGIILGGSPFTVTDPVEKQTETQIRVEAELAELLDLVVAEDFPFLGACYGIGVVGRHQAAVVDRTYSEPVGATTVALSAAGRADPLLGVLPEVFDAFVGHKDSIARLPDGLVNLAGSQGCPVQAFRVRQNVYVTQFHPELDVPGIVTRIDTYRHHGYFEPDRADELIEMARASSVEHPELVVRRFVELFARD